MTENKLRSVAINRGAVRGGLYFFDRGEGLPLHDHDETTAHVTFVMKGSIEISGPRIAARTLVAGNVYDFPPHSPHQIVALEDDTIIWNAIK